MKPTRYDSLEEATRAPIEIITKFSDLEDYLNETDGFFSREGFQVSPSEEEFYKFIYVPMRGKRQIENAPFTFRHEIGHSRGHKSEYFLGHELEAIYWGFSRLGINEEDMKGLSLLRRRYSKGTPSDLLFFMEQEALASEAIGFPLVKDMTGYPKGTRWSNIEESKG